MRERSGYRGANHTRIRATQTCVVEPQSNHYRSRLPLTVYPPYLEELCPGPTVTVFMARANDSLPTDSGD